MSHLGVYNSSKHAILGPTKTDAIDYAKMGIRINAVAPGFTDTPLLLDSTKEALKATIDCISQGRLASPKEVADAVSFLLRGLATPINGVTLPVDGALTAT
jgi:NAD(P)-dependent dehydrogenase (short-subunit alcohol dehydrogenase family)